MSLLTILKESTEGDFDVESFGPELATMIEKEILSIFPKSYVESHFSSNLGTAVSVKFALGKDRNEWTNGIIQNDPCHFVFHVWINKDGSMETEAGSMGFSVATKPEEGSYMAQGRFKIGWRKSKQKSGDAKKVVSVFSKNFKKLKDTLKQLIKDDLLFDPELAKSKI